MKRIAIVVIVLTISAYSKPSNPYVTLKYDKVVMYDFEGGKHNGIFSIIDKNGQLASTVSRQVQLDRITALNLSRIIGLKKSYGHGTAFCFEPHLGFIYYMKGSVVAHLTICLECNQLVSSLEIPAQKQGKVGEVGNEYYIKNGMSTSLRFFLIKLLKKHTFSHQSEVNIFEK